MQRFKRVVYKAAYRIKLDLKEQKQRLMVSSRRSKSEKNVTHLHMYVYVKTWERYRQTSSIMQGDLHRNGFNYSTHFKKNKKNRELLPPLFRSVSLAF